ncbi:hypothetical protein HY768_05540 [candidate division TA06 bacterium]|uniref:Lipoprotein n=1 Tax=candidate division TA06 bacterium TaxID=2250710 RepID=A0A933IB98_UNCT6|nr:hypothetical protein [candidate division TA06 bacterium]
MRISVITGQLKKIFYLVSGILVLAGVSCTYHPDLKQNFQMSLDGSKYVWESGPALGYVHGLEIGNPKEIKAVEIIYPLMRDTQRPLPGLQLYFDPWTCKTGKQIKFDRNTPGFELSFRPPYRPFAKEGLVMGYSTKEGEGVGELLINSRDIRANGAVSRKIVHARLYVYYYNPETGEVTKAQKPSVLEIWDFPFEVRLAVAQF